MCDWETELVIRHYAEETISKWGSKHRNAVRWLRDLLEYPDQNRGFEIARERHGFPYTKNALPINPCVNCETMECTWPEDDGTDTCKVSPKYRSTYHCVIYALVCSHCGLGFQRRETDDPNWPANKSADPSRFNCPYCGAPGHPFIDDIIIEFPPQVKA